MSTYLNPKWIVGKTVARVDLNTARDSDPSRQAIHNPVIYFTDGSSIAFVTEETYEGAEYGTNIVYRKARPQKKD